MLKDDVQEQVQRLRRRIQRQFATLPLPLATYVPPLLHRINKTTWGPLVAGFGLMLLISAAASRVWFSAAPSTVVVVVEPQWVPVVTTTTTTAAPLPLKVTAETAGAAKALQVDETAGAVKATEPTRDACAVYWDRYETINETCGVMDAAEQIVCLSPAVRHKYGGETFMRSPVIYDTGGTRAMARGTLLPQRGPTTATVWLPYSVIYFDAEDHKRRVTVTDDACLQMFVTALRR